MPAHFRLAPSSSHRWINCPGSARTDLPNESSEAAERGTLAHKIAELTLKGETWPVDVLVAFGELTDDEQTEMMDGVQLFVDFVTGIPGQLHSEQQIANLYIEDNGGTIDITVVTDDTIHVVDFKYGVMFVPCKGNTQVGNYLILAKQKFPGRTKFLGSIVQPRVLDGRIETQSFSIDELNAIESDIISASEDDTLHAGEWCKWCPLLVHCDTAYAKAREMADEEFDLIADIDRMVEIVEFAPVVSSMAKAAEAQMLAYIKSGGKIAGYKAAQGLGHRKYRDEGEARAELQALGYDMARLEDRSLKSPAQLEKVIPKTVVAKFTYRPKSQVSVVPESSKLDEISFTDEFEVID